MTVHIDLMHDYSLEITAKDVASLRNVASEIVPGTMIAIPALPGEPFEDHVAAARAIRELGFEPMPHLAARNIASVESFERLLGDLVSEAGVRRCFVIAGDTPLVNGPFADSLALIATGAFERHDIACIGIGAHPDGHPHMSEARCWDVLDEKCMEIKKRAMAPLIVTQFGFDAAPYLHWLKDLRVRGISDPVRIGVPGPAGVRTLLRYAARCGVSASRSVMAKYGLSVTRLIGQAGPDRLVGELCSGLRPEHGRVALHFYPFGGLGRTVQWINDYSDTGCQPAIRTA